MESEHQEANVPVLPSAPVLSEEQKAIDKRILRKIDWLILPLCALNYFFSAMDRGDIGNAEIAGFKTDNNLTDKQYSTVVSLFYVGYVLFQPIGGLLITKIEAYKLLAAANVFWGILTIMLMFSKSIILPGILRVFIGAAEGLTQINNVFLTMWYTKEEMAVRTGIWYSSGALSNSFNGLIAYGIQSRPTSNLKPWQLLFIVEGVLPIAFGPILYYFYPSSPANVKKYFTPEEKELCMTRSRRAKNSPDTKATLKKAMTIFKSPEMYAFWIAYWCVIWAAQGYGTFLPSIVKGLGYNTVDSQLLTVPITFVGFLSINFWCWISDKIQLRGPLIVGLCLTAIAGFAILLGVAHATGPRIFALCLVAFSVQPLIPLTLSFLFSNTVGVSRRALAIPLQNAVGQLGGLAVSYTFIKPPRYIMGGVGTICMLGLLMVIISLLDVYFIYLNRRKAAQVGTEKWQLDLTKSYDDLGTDHPEFTFML